MAPNAMPSEQAKPMAVVIVVLRRSGANRAAMLGRLSVPALRLAAHTGDSGKNGRMTISGIAGIRPEISKYRHGACWFAGSIVPIHERKLGIVIGGKESLKSAQMPAATATSKPPNDENACV